MDSQHMIDVQWLGGVQVLHCSYTRVETVSKGQSFFASTGKSSGQYPTCSLASASAPPSAASSAATSAASALPTLSTTAPAFPLRFALGLGRGAPRGFLLLALEPQQAHLLLQRLG